MSTSPSPKPEAAGTGPDHHRRAVAGCTSSCPVPPGAGWSVVVAVALVASLLSIGAMTPTPAGAQDDRPEVTLNGRGWGHGRGMSQYGALGYATDFGWSSAQILDHYYGGTTAGPAPSPGKVDPDRVRADLVFMRGRPTTVSLADGTMHLMSADGSTIRRVTGAVRLTLSGGSIDVASAPGCQGPWSLEPSIAAGLVRVEAETASTGQSGLLEVCGPSFSTWYDGEIWATSSGSDQRTVNLVTIEQYLRGVVPNEMPALWSLTALEVQAVAARSYALAGDTRWSGYADTCDTTTCQVYDGRFTTRAGWRMSTHDRTDAAIVATAGVVRLESDGDVARTEFSSSTGGYTAGGDFPAVIDEGDAVSANSNHQWQVTADLQWLEDDYDLGRLLGMSVTERNRLGPAGGRAITVKFQFDEGVVLEDAETIRRRFGLKSNWFSIARFTRGGVPVVPVDSEAIATFVDQAYQRLGGRQPTDDEAARWRSALRSQPRLNLTEELVHTQYFAGVLVDDLYLAALGRPADAEGRQYWVDTMAQGLKYEHLGTLFYGSPEYVNRAGGTNSAFVASLYRKILGREPDAEGRSYWLGLLDGQRAAPADVANAFYRSVESRRDRSRSVYTRVMATQPTDGDIETYSERLLIVDDLKLAAEMAASIDFPAESPQ